MRFEWKLVLAGLVTTAALGACGKDDDGGDIGDAGDTSDVRADVDDATSDSDADAPATCDELDCDDQQRVCIEGEGETPDACGDCLEGYEELDGACVPIAECEVDDDCGEPVAGPWDDCEYATECTSTGLRRRMVTTFSCDAGVCEGTRAEQSESDAPACDRATELEPCEDGVCRDQACVAIQGCDDLDCEAQRRTCDEGSGDGAEPACGDCVEGSIDVDGICAPSVVCDEDADCGEAVPGPWGACAWADACDLLGDRERGVAGFDCIDNACVPAISLESETDSEACSRDTSAIACDGGYCVDGACDDFDFCDELACEDVNRTCNEADGINDADCGDCIAEHVERDGACEPLVECDDLACGLANRDCAESDGFNDAVCTVCLDGFRDDGGTCISVASCADVGCSAQNRACVERDGTADAYCVGCLDGFVDDGGTCIAGDCLTVGDCTASAPGTWSACSYENVCDPSGDRSRTVYSPVCNNNQCGETSSVEVENDAAACLRDTERDSCGTGGQCFSGSCVEVAPDAPTGVSATDGDFDDRVAVSWNPSPNARGYIVYRDGRTIGVVSTTSFEDFGADEGEVGAPANVTASTDRVGEVELAWDAAPSNPGTSSTYTVAAFNDLGTGSSGTGDTGFRAAPEVTGYEVEIDGAEWFEALASPYVDSAAPAPSVVFTSINLNRGEFVDRVRCEAVVTPTAGAEVAYRVRAITTHGAGEASAPSYGSRAPGAVTLQWQRTTTDNVAAPYGNILGGTTAIFVNTSITMPVGGGLWYRLRATMSDVGEFTSDPKRANLYYEGAPCDDSCFFGVCSVGFCAPNGFSSLPPGTFTMGSPLGEIGRSSGNLENQVEVTLTNLVFMQTLETTQAEWIAVYGTNPSARSNCSTCPVESITWYSAIDFANQLSTRAGLPACYSLPGDCTGSAAAGTLACSGVTITSASGSPYDCTGFRLPMESEWEYGYRAGTTTPIYSGTINSGTGCAAANEPDLSSIAYYCGNSPVPGSAVLCPTTPTSTPCGTQPVGNRGANAWGLRDMAGNVGEWTFDYFYGAAASIGGTNPVNPVDATFRRVARGGGFGASPSILRAAAKERIANTAGFSRGFRIVRTSPNQPPAAP